MRYLITESREPNFLWTSCWFLGFIFLCACDSSPSETFNDDRSLWQKEVRDDQILAVLPGVFDEAYDDHDAVIRLAAPTAELHLRTGVRAEGSLRMRVSNVFKGAQVEVGRVDFLSSESEDGCPSENRSAITCEDVADAEGRICTQGEPCPTGATCQTGFCVAETGLDSCTAPTRLTGRGPETEIDFELAAQPCRSIVYHIAAPDRQGVFRIGVMGTTDAPASILALLDDEGADMAVLLGNHLTENTPDGVETLRKVLDASGIPTVVIAGRDETAKDVGERFVQRLGPLQLTWQLGQTRFFSFFSAPGHLGSNGIAGLGALLRRAKRDGADGPLLAFSHTIPIDPNAVRGQGFTDDLQGAQTVSFLRSQGVHTLFTGHPSTTEQHRVDQLDLVMTTAQSGLISQEPEYLLVSIGTTAEVPSGRQVGQWAFDIEKRTL
jgi:hypothetical protein